MKKLVIVLVLFIYIGSFSQKIVVVDAETKEPLPFTTIKFNDTGIYSDINGVFETARIAADSIEISMLGYESYTTDLNTLRDSIFLFLKPTVLNEIIISRNQTIKNIEYLRKPNNLGEWPLQPGSEFLVFISPKKEIENFKINKLKIKFSKVSERKDLKNTDIKGFIRLLIYDVKNNLPNSIIFYSSPMDVNSFGKDEILVDISNQAIILNSEGLFVGLEMIGYFLDNEPVVDTAPVLRPNLTDQDSKYFDAKTYIRFTFDKQLELFPLNEILKNTTRKNYSRNLNIGLEIID